MARTAQKLPRKVFSAYQQLLHKKGLVAAGCSIDAKGDLNKRGMTMKNVRVYIFLAIIGINTTTLYGKNISINNWSDIEVKVTIAGTNEPKFIPAMKLVRLGSFPTTKITALGKNSNGEFKLPIPIVGEITNNQSLATVVLTIQKHGASAPKGSLEGRYHGRIEENS